MEVCLRKASYSLNTAMKPGTGDSHNLRIWRGVDTCATHPLERLVAPICISFALL
jgi:hypothetical protein